MIICIDPGHGGPDPGAVGLYGTKESIVNLQVAFRLQALCQRAGFVPMLTRNQDAFVELTLRGLMANNAGADCFVSLHCNAAARRDAWGLEVWTTRGQTASDPLAQQVCLQLKGAFNVPFRAELSDGDLDKEENYRVLVVAKCPAILVEMGFLSNPPTESLLKSPAHQEQMAAAILRGIQAWAMTRNQRVR
jgi:N-acetylmuramoyl-L-alanine amidase